MSSSDWIDEYGEEKVDLQLWKKLLRYTLHYRRTSILFVCAALVLAATDLCFPLVTGKVISDVQQNGLKADLVGYAWIFIVLALMLCISIWVFIACAGKIRTHVSHDIRRDAFQQLQELSFSFYDTKPVGWLMARLTSDCQRLSQILAWGVMDFVWGTTLMAGISGVMLFYNWRMALAVLVVVPLLFAVSLFFRKRILRVSRLVRKTNARITAAFNESILGVRTTKVFVRQDKNLRQFDELADEMRGHSIQGAVLNAVYLPIILSLGSVAIALALNVGGHQVVMGSLTVGETVMFIYYAQLFFGPIQDMSMWFAEMQMAQASAERVLSLIEAVPEVRDDEHVIRRRRELPTPDAIGQIAFEHVGFQYRNGPAVIEDLNMVVEPGETIALVGATGGGKTTLVNLLCRFYEPSHGRILMGGVDYRDRGLDWLHSKLGVVLQHPHLFSGTVGENIRYGRLNATAEEVREAAQLACADESISALERGYDTEVGEGGNQLSHGQKQLISFARAILRQPQLLIMDEATSSVDTQTEQQIQQGLARVLTGRTSFVIAHRLSTIRSADRILVIDKGRVVEGGRHIDLMRHGGRYYELYTDQSFRDAPQFALR